MAEIFNRCDQTRKRQQYSSQYGCALALLLLGGGCASPPAKILPPIVSLRTPRPPSKTVSPVNFIDVTQQAGLTWKHNNGAFGLKLYPETMGSGVAFIDFDGDGYQDIFLVNSRNWTPEEANAYIKGPGRAHHDGYGFALPPIPAHRRTTGALYRNNRDGTFRDVTKNSGLEAEMYGMGVAVGDYDNDGKPDLYVTSYGHNYLFRNTGNGRFSEVTEAAGVRDSGFGTSAMWVDYDRDGRLDLFVCRYIEWTPGIDIWNYGSQKKVKGGFLKTYAGPPAYNGQASHLYHNQGAGKFVDVSDKAGIYQPVQSLMKTAANPTVLKTRQDREAAAARAVNETLEQQNRRRGADTMKEGKSMGVALCDSNSDGWPDILVTNDTVRNYLFVNQKNGTFKEVGIKAGISYSGLGDARAGMGVDVGDIDRSGRDSVVIGNFAREYLGLYHSEGQSLFTDIARPSDVAGPSTAFLTFGCIFLDIDNDGWLDILAANGHVQDNVQNMLFSARYEQRPLLYLNLGQQPIKFDEIGAKSGAALQKKLVARGLAASDIDLDGDVDVIFTINGGTPILLRNEAAPTAAHNNVLRVSLVGTKSNRSAIGAIAETRFPQSNVKFVQRTVRSGSSYLSQSELPVVLGLANKAAPI